MPFPLVVFFPSTNIPFLVHTWFGSPPILAEPVNVVSKWVVTYLKNSKSLSKSCLKSLKYSLASALVLVPKPL